MIASAAASTAYSAEPDAARRVRPPAKIGVMVELAPQDRKRLFPKKANANEPPRKAKNPISGENPPSRAVAICSGIAMAARVRPATTSRVKNRRQYEFERAEHRPSTIRTRRTGGWRAGCIHHEFVALPEAKRAYANSSAQYRAGACRKLIRRYRCCNPTGTEIRTRVLRALSDVRGKLGTPVSGPCHYHSRKVIRHLSRHPQPWMGLHPHCSWSLAEHHSLERDQL